MPGYFSNFPLIDYNGKKIRDITKRAIAIEKIKNAGVPFQPLAITDQERVDFLSTLLFERPDYDYIFFMINNIVDPYYEWYLTEQQLEDLISIKYGGEGLSVRYYYYFDRYELISDTTYTIDNDYYFSLSAANRQLYQGIQDSKLLITPETYDALPAEKQELYTAVSNRTYEREENEKRKYLNAVLPQYGNLIHKQVRALLNDQQISIR